MAEGEVEQEYVQKPSGFEDLCSVALCIVFVQKTSGVMGTSGKRTDCYWPPSVTVLEVDQE